MRMHIAAAGLGGALFAIALAGQASAKHAFAALFDANAPVMILGTVTRVDWSSENVLVHVSGAQDWSVELPGLKGMIMVGLDKASFGPGDVVAIRGYRGKDRTCAPECFAMGRNITFADGLQVPMPPTPDDPHADKIHAQRVAARTAR